MSYEFIKEGVFFKGLYSKTSLFNGDGRWGGARAGGEEIAGLN